MSYEKPRSNWWYLLPILFSIIGGLISYFAIKHDDPKKAKYCLCVGLLLSFSVIGGILVSYVFDITPSGTIVLLSIAIFAVTIGIKSAGLIKST